MEEDQIWRRMEVEGEKNKTGIYCMREKQIKKNIQLNFQITVIESLIISIIYKIQITFLYPETGMLFAKINPFYHFSLLGRYFFSVPLLFYIVNFNVEFSYMHLPIIMSKISLMLLQRCILFHITLKNFTRISRFMTEIMSQNFKKFNSNSQSSLLYKEDTLQVNQNKHIRRSFPGKLIIT